MANFPCGKGLAFNESVNKIFHLTFAQSEESVDAF